MTAGFGPCFVIGTWNGSGDGYVSKSADSRIPTSKNQMRKSFLRGTFPGDVHRHRHVYDPVLMLAQIYIIFRSRLRLRVGLRPRFLRESCERWPSLSRSLGPVRWSRSRCSREYESPLALSRESSLKRESRLCLLLWLVSISSKWGSLSERRDFDSWKRDRDSDSYLCRLCPSGDLDLDRWRSLCLFLFSLVSSLLSW